MSRKPREGPLPNFAYFRAASANFNEGENKYADFLMRADVSAKPLLLVIL